MDLMFFDNAKINLGYSILLNIIEINTKYASCYALKNKQAKTIVEVLSQFLIETKNVKSVSFDKGSEFSNKLVIALFQRNDIKIYEFNKSTDDYSHN